MGEPMTTAAHAAATKAARGKRPPTNSCHAWTNASRGWPTPRTGSAGRWRRSATPERRRHTMDRPGPAAGINPEPIPSGGVTRWTAQARQDRVPRRAADLMDKRARPRLKRPRPRSGRGVRCTRHPCRQATSTEHTHDGDLGGDPQLIGAASRKLASRIRRGRETSGAETGTGLSGTNARSGRTV